MSTDAVTGGSAPPNPPPDGGRVGAAGPAPHSRENSSLHLEIEPTTHEPLEGGGLSARVFSAAILIPAALAVLLVGGPWIAGAAGFAAVLMAYEWARMSEPSATNPAFSAGLVGMVGATVLAAGGRPLWAFALLGLCALASAARRRTLAGMAETALGPLYIGAACVAFVWLSGQGRGGGTAVLGMTLILWAADSAAYFGGRFLRGPRLVPSLSPRKTWAGLICASAAGAAAGGAFAFLIHGSAVIWVPLGGGLAIVGVIGDLVESLAKRRFKVKDASGLIPGHGGVLDRLDGLLAASLALGGAVALWPHLLSSLVGMDR